MQAQDPCLTQKGALRPRERQHLVQGHMAQAGLSSHPWPVLDWPLPLPGSPSSFSAQLVPRLTQETPAFKKMDKKADEKCLVPRTLAAFPGCREQCPHNQAAVGIVSAQCSFILLLSPPPSPSCPLSSGRAEGPHKPVHLDLCPETR
jgi:hypothetical protein